MTETLYERAEVFISAKNLVDKDLFSKSDPFAVLFQKNEANAFVEVGRTNVLMDNLNPSWNTQFVLDYHFESIQEFKVAVYDEDARGETDLRRHTLLGEATFFLAQLMCSRGQVMKLQLVAGTRGNRGEVILKAEAVQNIRDKLRVQFCAQGLANKDGLFGKSDPYITAHKLREDGTWIQVWKSEVVDNNLSPTWGIAAIPIQTLCNGDYHRPIKLEIFDYDNPTSSETMGELQTSIHQLLSNPSFEYEVIEPAKKSKKSYKNSGKLSCRLVEIIHLPLFLDFVKGGCQVSMIAAIDFTGSNGAPNDPSSLHYIDPTGQRRNEYQQAITSVGNVIAEYDSDKLFPVYGFGAVVGRSVSHCFTVYPDGVEVQGVEGILHAYGACVQRVQFSGPTLFTPILQAAVARAAASPVDQGNQQYHVLLIITDGTINDMPQTIDTLIEASNLPLSVIIIGVGDADFTDMNRLDGDDGVLRGTGGRAAARDIVQFVPFRKYGPGRFSELAKEVLAEIPQQFLSFMASRNIFPNPPLVNEDPSLAPPAYEESKSSV